MVKRAELTQRLANRARTAPSESRGFAVQRGGTGRPVRKFLIQSIQAGLGRAASRRGSAMTISNADPAVLTSSEHSLQLRRAVIASTIGTAIEWYDFFLYSTVTGLVFAKLFFPHSDPWVGTLEAFAIYAVGFVARPVGAAIFGHYADRIGRKSKMLATTVLLAWRSCFT